MQLLSAHPDLDSRTATVHLADIGSYRSVFAANARGVVPVGRIDDQALPVDDRFVRSLDRIYESVPWDRI
jgi:hypothetical protein